MDGQFVKLCKRLVLQFVIVKPVLVVCTIVLYSQGLYTEGDWSAGSSCAPRRLAPLLRHPHAVRRCAVSHSVMATAVLRSTSRSDDR